LNAQKIPKIAFERGDHQCRDRQNPIQY
jgi:hypothetical protein